MDEREQLLRRLYEAFNARDVDGVLAFMHDDVDWPNAWEGGRVRGRRAVRDYWARQFEAIDPRVEAEGFAQDDQGRLAVEVHQVVRDRAGELLADRRVRHVYTFREGLIERMDVIE
jgi:hypothetical protein